MSRQLHIDSPRAQQRQLSTQSGFTLIELLVVIVVLAILAAIVLISYNGIQDRAVEVGLQSDLHNGADQLGLDNTDNGRYPATLAAANGGQGLRSSPGNDFTYDVNSDGSAYCLSARSSTHPNAGTWHIGSGNNLQQGDCPGDLASGSGSGGSGSGGGDSGSAGGSGGGSDAANCTDMTSCLTALDNAALAYASSKGITIQALLAGQNATDDNGNAVKSGKMAAFVATLPGWTYKYVDTSGGLYAAVDPSGDNGYELCPAIEDDDTTCNNGFGDPEAIGGTAEKLDGSQMALAAFLSNGTVLLPATPAINIPVQDSDTSSLFQAFMVFTLIEGYEWAYTNNDNATVTTDQLLDATSNLTGGSDNGANDGLLIGSGPAGGPWTFKVNADKAAGQIPDEYLNCQFNFSAVDNRRIKFDGYDCSAPAPVQSN